jgi:hypothetical protein
MSVMSRPPGEPRDTPAVTGAPPAEVIPAEYCDRCGAASRHRVLIAFQLPDGRAKLGPLTFCSHHYDEHRAALLAAGIWTP